MFAAATSGLAKNTSFKVVLPFYFYAALCFLFASILLIFSSAAFTQHYFHPYTLTVTHAMALGWGTMIILGASHQLVPVLIEGALFSDFLAYCSFIAAALGIPLLLYGFYHFDFSVFTKAGAILINLAIIFYLVNLAVSMARSKKENVHAIFVFTAALWLLITTLLGLLLLYNFTSNILSNDSLYYLPVHAHIGVIGWFLLMVMGVGSRLIPLFLISKYHNEKLLWWIFILINLALIIFIFNFLFSFYPVINFFCVGAIALAIGLFGYYCRKAYQQRLRRKVDGQLRISLLSIAFMVIPVVLSIVLIILSFYFVENNSVVLAYGFCIFFGWITAIILGMTFKTLPFILWNRTYHHRSAVQKTPNPKDLFNSRVFNMMAVAYLIGFVVFLIGIFGGFIYVLQVGAVCIFLSAILFNLNIFKMVIHKPDSK
ncbi:MAG: cytochrome C oxidase subunit I [Bacteroidetes bacterium]|nr:cytochrome C oxidase subunit I [Bacteroidota bacterium]